MEQLTGSRSRFRLRRIFVGVFIVLTIAIVLFVIKYIFESRQISAASRVSNSFVMGLINGNAQEAYQLTSPDFRQYTDENKLDKYTKALRPYISSVPEPDLNISHQIGPFKKLRYENIVYFVDERSGKGEVKVVLEKSNGKWLVTALSADIK